MCQSKHRETKKKYESQIDYRLGEQEPKKGKGRIRSITNDSPRKIYLKNAC